MSRLGVSIRSQRHERAAPPPDRYGRRVRYVNGVERAESEARLIDPLFLKLALGLTVIMILTMAGSLWRLFSFHP